MAERESTHVFHMRKGWSIDERERAKKEKSNEKKAHITILKASITHYEKKNVLG